jgi:hypothetical protein
MSIETEKKRLTDFLAEQTAVHEANKRRAIKHYEATIARSTPRSRGPRITSRARSQLWMRSLPQPQKRPPMRTPDFLRQRRARRRRRFGLRKVHIEISPETIEFLEKPATC